MTDFAPPARNGMPLWARWTLIGCGGCLLIVILGFVGCSTLVYQFFNKSFKLVDVADKPDPPLTATAAQLFPAQVDSFVRKSLGAYSPPNSSAGRMRGWQAWYIASGRRVQIVARPTRAGAADFTGSPFESQPPRTRNRSQGFHFNRTFGSKALDMIVWSKPNWTFVIQSPDQAAEAFFRAYRPGVRRSGVQALRRHETSGVRR